MEKIGGLPNSKEVKGIRHLQRQVTISLKDRKHWVKVVEETEVSAASGNIQSLFKRHVGEQWTSVSEAVCVRSGERNLRKQQ